MTHYLDAAVEAARAAGEMLRHGFQQPLRVNSAEAHDIKLEIDVRTCVHLDFRIWTARLCARLNLVLRSAVGWHRQQTADHDSQN